MSDSPDIGNRGALTAGTHLQAFASLIERVAAENGLGQLPDPAEPTLSRIPGYFRESKDWDIHLRIGSQLLAAIEIKSMSSSFANNIQNRVEEVVGTGVDFHSAFRQHAFGPTPYKVFLGYVFIVVDCPKSRRRAPNYNTNYSNFELFDDTTYIDRLNILCKRLASERIYDEACLITTPESAVDGGAFSSVEPSTSIHSFLFALASHVRRVVLESTHASP